MCSVMKAVRSSVAATCSVSQKQVYCTTLKLRPNAFTLCRTAKLTSMHGILCSTEVNRLYPKNDTRWMGD